MKTTLMILIAVMTIQTSALAQTANPMSDTLRWNASGFIDQNTNASFQKPCQFVTYGSSKIDWIQKGGKLTYTLTVSNVSGTWADANADGTITYTVSFEDFTGSATITRAGAAISFTLNLTSADDKINNLYTVSTFDIL